MLELNITHQGDCLELMKQIPDKSIDIVLTDPPYGVNLDITNRPTGMRKHIASGYIGFEDTPECIQSLVIPAINEAIRIAKRVVVTCGRRNMFKYPEPKTVWCLYCPAGAGRGEWNAFNCWQPVLCYGEAVKRRGCYADTISYVESSEANGHPCPKPIKTWTRLLELVSDESEVVLDSFMGSGTTGVAAIQTGRRFIGIELSPEYCKLANDRCAAAKLQIPLNEYRQGQGVLWEEY